MKITLHTILGIKQAIGEKTLEIDIPRESTIEDFLAYMKRRWGEKLYPHLFNPADDTLNPHVRVMVNGQTIQYLQGMNTPLNEGDEVLILPPASGG
jgi:molybdopterin synthase sulfur carrier subunit